MAGVSKFVLQRIQNPNLKIFFFFFFFFFWGGGGGGGGALELVIFLTKNLNEIKLYFFGGGGGGRGV